MSDVYVTSGKQQSLERSLNRKSDLVQISDADVAADAAISSSKLRSYVAEVTIPINQQYVVVRHNLDAIPRFVSTTHLMPNFHPNHSVVRINRDTVTLDLGVGGVGAVGRLWVKVEA